MVELIFDHFPDLTAKQREQFSSLKELYSEWNQKINVISRQDIDNLYLRHVLHSLAIAVKIEQGDNIKILDVGTGGGFPGVPLAILFPDIEFHLIDSIRKKIRVVDAVIESLSLTNSRAEAIRAEELKGHYHYVVSRAVTALPRFIPWVWEKIVPSTPTESRGILYLKGGDLDGEIAEAAKVNRLKKGQIERIPLSELFNDEWFLEKSSYL